MENQLKRIKKTCKLADDHPLFDIKDNPGEWIDPDEKDDEEEEGDDAQAAAPTNKIAPKANVSPAIGGDSASATIET